MNKMEEVKKLIRSAVLLACSAAHYAAEDTKDDLLKIRYESGAVAIALRGLSDIKLARALYVMIDSENELIERVFAQYETFVDEITDDFTTNHSHQWTLIRKQELLDLVRDTDFYINSPYEDE